MKGFFEGNKQKSLGMHWENISFLLALYDFFSVFLAYTLALFLRFDFEFSKIMTVYWDFHIRYIWIYAAVCVVIYFFFHLYHSLWRFASYTELVSIVEAVSVCSAGWIIVTWIVHLMPISYYMAGTVCHCGLTVGVRFSYRLLLLLRARAKHNHSKNRVMLIGAGIAGQAIMRDVVNVCSDVDDKICCIIDDNSNKWGRYIDNVPIVGGRESIFECVEKYNIDKIYFAIPSATAEERRDILQICQETECVVKQLPSMYQLIEGDVRINQMKDVSVEDLLGREPIQTDMSGVYQFIQGKVVLVTGGGGSIGSEICRQVASHSPKQLIIFDIYENNAYNIQLELKESFPNLNLVTLIGSVRDSRRIEQVFETYHPDIVYHAAAHKHVPLMEDSPCESIKNNVIGTYKTAYAALLYGTKRFVLISTDKAVNPTNIMGASKRLCEMVVQSFDRLVREGKEDQIPEIFTHGEPRAERKRTSCQNVKTEFVAVRFGNVLGSNGSVIPVFKKQIARGGPVTVTHPDIIRYFMTVPEAVSLVMLAGTYAHGGEIFVLDMGSPMKIDTLARNLIRLSGLKPDVDISIEYTGLRPGEKLYEEKLMEEEGLKKTENKLIHIGSPIAFDAKHFVEEIPGLMAVAYANDELNIRKKVASFVPTYRNASASLRNTKDEVYQKLYAASVKDECSQET